MQDDENAGVVMNIRKLLIGVALSAAFIAPAAAADLAKKPVYKAPPPAPVWNPWMIRVRALGVLPEARGSSVTVGGFPVLSSPNSGLSIGNSLVPEADISYFFTPNIAAEVVLGVTPHWITGTGTLNNIDVGHAWLLPPTLLLQYHFTQFGAFKPAFTVNPLAPSANMQPLEEETVAVAVAESVGFSTPKAFIKNSGRSDRCTCT